MMSNIAIGSAARRAQAVVAEAGRLAGLDQIIAQATEALLSLQQAEGHWVFELEADATIPSEYVLFQHYRDCIRQNEQDSVATYLRDIQGSHGGWPLYYGGPFELNASIKAYFALKATGESPDAPHMVRAREAILAHGGARNANVFTRITLALFGQIPWSAVPVMPVELMLLPRWFPFHIDKVAYWSRTVIVPLAVIMAVRPAARNPRNVSVRELFIDPPETVTDWITGTAGAPLSHAFAKLDQLLRVAEPFFPKASRKRAIDKAVAWVTERLNGEDGLGGIYPAMANAAIMYDCLGYSPEHPSYATALSSVRKLYVPGERAYCQPCLSPVWDTALACHALLETGDPQAEKAVTQALDWLQQRQILDVVGDWAGKRPGLRPGGWAFQFENPHYPDLDDTAVVGLVMDRADSARYRTAIERATEWILGMQSRNGGFAAFDADNTCYYLNHIPFADHGALLDPPTADVSARCLGLLAQLGYRPDHAAVQHVLKFLRSEQEADGSWFGRWGTNYIYGTWSVLCGLNAIGIGPDAPEIRRAVSWLVERQRADGGWGEGAESYLDDGQHGEAPYSSTASQTAWALLGLMAAGEVDHPAVARGIAYLEGTQNQQGLWDEEWYTAVGFPKVFYLRYHGYRAFFPLWALARYRRLAASNARQVTFGI